MKTAKDFDTKEFDRLLEEYIARFGQGVPIGISERKFIGIMRECLRTGKPYEYQQEILDAVKNGALI